MNRTRTQTPTSLQILSLSVLFFLLLSTFTAMAQISIQIGISRDKAVRTMVANGYEQIKILDKGFKTVKAQACLNGSLHVVRIDSKYRVKKLQRLGACRNRVSIGALEKNLENSGYTRIVMERQNGNFVAIACRNEARFRITYTSQGELLQRRNIGQCEAIFEPNDVRKVLRDKGYNRIRFTDRRLPWYTAQACNRKTKYELLLTRYGDIRKSTKIGNCAPPVNPNKLAAFLNKRGYDRVEIIDKKLPTYRAAACSKNDRVELDLNRYGAITSRQVIGKCTQRMQEQEIARLLRREGFSRIKVARASNGNFEVSSCYQGYEKFATLSAYGELLFERDGKRCAARNLRQVNKNLSDRGFRNLEYYAEGCRKGKRIRITLDKNGDRIGRENLGNC